MFVAEMIPRFFDGDLALVRDIEGNELGVPVALGGVAVGSHEAEAMRECRVQAGEVLLRGREARVVDLSDRNHRVALLPVNGVAIDVERLGNSSNPRICWSC